MNILFITGRYGKKAAANGICTKNVIDELVKSNKVFCMCYDDFSDETYEKVNIIKIRRGILQSLIYKSEENRKITGFIDKLVKIRNLFFIPVWPLTDPIYTLKAYIKAKKLCKTENIDMVIGVHMPLSSLIVASKLKKKNKKIKYIAYFLDSLSGGKPLSIMSLEWNTKKKLKWERKLLENADKIIFMEASRKHQEKYNSKTDFYKRVVYLDIPLLKRSKKLEKNYFKNDKINVSFCGTANYPLRNLPYLLNVIEKIKDKNIIFHFFGNSNYDGLVNSKLDNVKYYSSVSHEQVEQILASSDILLNLGTKVISTISGKIFEYMSYGKPIISTFSIKDESCIPYLIKYKNSNLIDENNDNIEEEAYKLEKFIKENVGKNVEFEKLEKLFYNNTPTAFADEILKKE